MVYLSRKKFNELQGAVRAAEAKAEGARLELKGYYDENNEQNDYLKAVALAMKRTELAPASVLSRDQIRDLYTTSLAVQGVVNYIADNVGEVARYLELTKNGEVVENHWALDLLKKPNDRYTTRKFVQAWAINKLLYGDAWIFIPETVGADRNAKEMYLIPSWRVAVDHGKMKPIEGIEILGSKRKKVDTSRVFESFDYNLDDSSAFGTSKIVAAALYLSVMDKGMRRQEAALNNGGVSNIVTPAKDNMGVMPKDADEVENRLNNRTNTGKTLALRIPVDVHALGNAPVDLSILESHKEAVTALCFVFKVPVDLYYGQAKYENAKEAKKTIYEQNAIPMANELAEDLIHFLKLDEEGYELKVNTDLIDVLKDDAGDVLDNLTKMHASLNEMREAYGYEPRPEPWADLPIMPMGLTFGNEAAMYEIDELSDTEPAEE